MFAKAAAKIQEACLNVMSGLEALAVGKYFWRWQHDPGQGCISVKTESVLHKEDFPLLQDQLFLEFR